jgi:hypothetical protein
LAEIFSHLRSSLDHLTCALAIANGNSEAPRGTQFPIFRDKAVFKALDKTGKPKQGSGLSQMRGVGGRVQAIIQSLQPYKRGADATSHPLWILHDFAIIDKHRKPQITGAILTGGSANFGPMRGVDLSFDDFGVIVGAFKSGTEIARLHFTIRNPADYVVQMNVDFTYDVAFNPKGPGKGQLVVPTVRSLIDYLRTVVVSKLEPLV